MPKSVTPISMILLRAALAAFAAVLAFAPMAQAGVEDALKRVEQDGRARVIVRMRTDDGSRAAAPAWGGAQSAAQQKSTVQRARGRLTDAMRAKRIEVRAQFETLPFVGAVVDRAQLLDLATMPEVESIHLVQIERKQQILSRPNLTTSVPSIDIADAWARGFEGSGYAVAVIDSGFNTSHPMLQGKAVGDACFASDFGTVGCAGGFSPQVAPGAASNCPAGSDRCDHGTIVASIAVGDDGTTFGVAPAARLVPIDVFSRYTDATLCSPDPAPCDLTDSEAVLHALDYVNQRALELNIAAVNLSVGGAARDGYCDDDPRTAVIDMLRAKGVAVVVAAGNGGLTGQVYAPACISSAIAVGATDDGVGVAEFSNFARTLDVMAPGVNIRAAAASGGLRTVTGTSVAAPHVAGAWAVLREAFPDASFDVIENAVKRTGAQTTRLGSGFEVPKIQVARAILRLEGRDRQTFSSVVASEAGSIGQAYLRFHNDSATAGFVTVTLREGDTGAEIGTWTSPRIPAHAAMQFDIRDLEDQARVLPIARRRTYFNLDVESTFVGYMQHVQWTPDLNVITNMSACGDGFSADSRSAANIHTTHNVDYPSRLRLTNTGGAPQAAELTFYASGSGQDIGTWTSPEIPAGASLEVTMAQIENEAPDVAEGIERGLWQVNATLGSLNGHLQHVIQNSRSGVLVDMTPKCDLGLRGE